MAERFKHTRRLLAVSNLLLVLGVLVLVPFLRGTSKQGTVVARSAPQSQRHERFITNHSTLLKVNPKPPAKAAVAFGSQYRLHRFSEATREHARQPTNISIPGHDWIVYPPEAKGRIPTLSKRNVWGQPKISDDDWCMLVHTGSVMLSFMNAPDAATIEKMVSEDPNLGKWKGRSTSQWTDPTVVGKYGWSTMLETLDTGKQFMRLSFSAEKQPRI